MIVSLYKYTRFFYTNYTLFTAFNINAIKQSLYIKQFQAEN